MTYEPRVIKQGDALAYRESIESAKSLAFERLSFNSNSLFSRYADSVATAEDGLSQELDVWTPGGEHYLLRKSQSADSPHSKWDTITPTIIKVIQTHKDTKLGETYVPGLHGYEQFATPPPMIEKDSESFKYHEWQKSGFEVNATHMNQLAFNLAAAKNQPPHEIRPAQTGIGGLARILGLRRR